MGAFDTRFGNALRAYLYVAAASAATAATQAQQVWMATYKANQSSDEFADMKMDSAGNVCVLGRSKYGYATVKFDATGKKKWAATYNPSSAEDNPSRIALDGAGNVHVTGSSSGGSTAFDIATLKYGSSGAKAWLVRYNNSESNSDFGNDIAVDGSGNVYVTGGSRSDETDYDYVTIKYDPSGVQRWKAVYVGDGILPGESYDDSAYRITLDSAGNVYVTGVSQRGSVDIITVKYDSAGRQQWASRYDGPDHLYDQPSDIAVDGSGNVYVIGSSQGMNTAEDIITIKYDSAGVELWNRRYTSSGQYPEDAQDLALDKSGNVYLTGSINTSGNNNFITIKYNPSGARMWAAVYDYATYGDGAYALALDAAGNAYVTGDGTSKTLSTDLLLLKYNPKGKRQWVVHDSGAKHFDLGRAIALDGSNNIIVAGESLQVGWIIIKYAQ